MCLVPEYAAWGLCGPLPSCHQRTGGMLGMLVTFPSWQRRSLRKGTGRMTIFLHSAVASDRHHGTFNSFLHLVWKSLSIWKNTFHKKKSLLLETCVSGKEKGYEEALFWANIFSCFSKLNIYVVLQKILTHTHTHTILSKNRK